MTVKFGVLYKGLSGFSRSWKKLTVTLGFTSGKSQLFPGPTESL